MGPLLYPRSSLTWRSEPSGCMQQHVAVQAAASWISFNVLINEVIVLTRVEKISKENIATQVAKTYSSMLVAWISLKHSIETHHQTDKGPVKTCKSHHAHSAVLIPGSFSRTDTKLREGPVIGCHVLKACVRICEASVPDPSLIGLLRYGYSLAGKSAVIAKASVRQHFGFDSETLQVPVRAHIPA